MPVDDMRVRAGSAKLCQNLIADIFPVTQRMMVKDTDKGKELVTQIQDLKKLLVAYRTGLIKEKV